MSNIRFERCMSAGYAARTKANADGADLTLAIYATFSTAGERLTRECALEAGKFYHGLNVAKGPVGPHQVADKLCLMPFGSINFAGNGLYTMCKYGWLQEDCDAYARELLAAILVRRPIRLVRSGGQTGLDEAGVKAADFLGIPALVLAPKNWTYRTGDGVDHHDEEAFKARFLCKK